MAADTELARHDPDQPDDERAIASSLEHALSGGLRGGWANLWATVASAAIYVGLGILIYERVIFASQASLPGCNCGDQAQEVWFLRWPLYAIAHGHNPFFSSWMDFPKGVNLAINTSAPLLGIVSAPLQLTVGTVSAYDMMLVLCIAASALSMSLVIRRWVRSRFAAFVAGLCYGFSPYMFGQGHGHLFLVATFLPPIVLLVLDDVLVRQKKHPTWLGVALGLLLAAQYFISPEIMVMTVVMAAVGVVILVLARPHEVRARAPYAAWAVGCGVVICAAALAYPLWMQLAGPRHVKGPPHPIGHLAVFPGDLLGPVVPTTNQTLGWAAWKAHGDAFTGTNTTENGMYLGIPLVVVLAAFLVWLRRTRAMVFFAAMGVVAAILALGSHLVVDAHKTHFPLPFDVLAHLPFTKDILAVRFSLFEQLFAASMLGVGLDRLLERLRHRDAAAAHARGGLGVPRAAVAWGICGLVGVVALGPLVPGHLFTAAATQAPAFFSSPAVQRIPEGSAVLAYPYPLVPDAEWNMTFQVQAAMRYKLVGGDAFRPGPDGKSVSTPLPTDPIVVEQIFADAYTLTWARSALGKDAAPTIPPIDQHSVAGLQSYLRRFHISTVIVCNFGTNPAQVVSYVTAALGPPQETGGVWAWFDVPGLLTHAPPASAAGSAPAAAPAPSAG